MKPPRRPSRAEPDPAYRRSETGDDVTRHNVA